ncbi:B-cell receptor CD22-like isoform X3 [Dermochelys coriacea]|uniref:B-cell receptor CD22-like isoform X3 n=1 Tax=Dermochelys coriacea TaxID=27794 RepID=UPI0018E8E948|nr:B-cell receptor CD22-like isoform X3 [Dermochelys coriacea]
MHERDVCLSATVHCLLVTVHGEIGRGSRWLTQPQGQGPTSTFTLEEMEALLLLALSILTGAGCQDWGVTLPVDPLAGWSGSCVTIPCSYTYPDGQLVRAVTWSRNKERIVRLTAAAGQGYGKAERAQFLGDLQHNCTLRLNPLALGDGGAYFFEFQTQNQSWRSPRALCLTVSEHPCRVNYGLARTGGALSGSLFCSISERCTSSGLYWYDVAGTRILAKTAAGQHESRLSMHIIWQHRGAALECRVQGYQNRCLPKGSQPPATGRTPHLKVLVDADSPGPIREGDSFTLRCVEDSRSLDQFYSWVHNNEDLPGGPSVQIKGATLSHGGNYTCMKWVSGTGSAYLAISPTTYVAILDSSDWYQLSPGPMAGLGAGVLLLFLLSNFAVYCLASRIRQRKEPGRSLQEGSREDPSAPQGDSLYEEIPYAGEIPCPSDDNGDYYNSTKDYCN